MKISGYRQSYDAFSSKTSEICRQLSFAGLALIWIFKEEKAGVPSVPEQMLLPAILFVAALALDLLHAAYGTVAWGVFSRFHEKRENGEDIDVLAPAWINWASIGFFFAKVNAVVVGYALALDYIYGLYKPV